MNNITGEHQALPEEMLTKKNKYHSFSLRCGGSQDDSFPLPFHIPQLVKSLSFYIPEARKRYLFRTEPPRLGHYKEYLRETFTRMR